MGISNFKKMSGAEASFYFLPAFAVVSGVMLIALKNEIGFFEGIIVGISVSWATLGAFLIYTGYQIGRMIK